MRLIDADKLRQYALDITGKSEIAFDNCFPYWKFSKAIKSAEKVEAIPVEWIRQWATKDGFAFPNWLREMIKDWEKENEK